MIKAVRPSTTSSFKAQAAQTGRAIRYQYTPIMTLRHLLQLDRVGSRIGIQVHTISFGLYSNQCTVARSDIRIDKSVFYNAPQQQARYKSDR